MVSLFLKYKEDFGSCSSNHPSSVHCHCDCRQSARKSSSQSSSSFLSFSATICTGTTQLQVLPTALSSERDSRSASSVTSPGLVSEFKKSKSSRSDACSCSVVVAAEGLMPRRSLFRVRCSNGDGAGTRTGGSCVTATGECEECSALFSTRSSWKNKHWKVCYIKIRKKILYRMGNLTARKSSKSFTVKNLPIYSV